MKKFLAMLMLLAMCFSCAAMAVRISSGTM